MLLPLPLLATRWRQWRWRDDETAERNILAIIKREKDKAFWRRLNYALGKHVRGQSVRAVQVEDGAGGVQDVNTEEAVQEAIFNEVHCKQYNLAEEAPICQGVLRGQFGYTATSPTARSVLDGTYEFPPEMDAATNYTILYTSYCLAQYSRKGRR